MFAAAFVDIGLMLLSGILNAGAASTLMMFVAAALAVPAIAAESLGRNQSGPDFRRRNLAGIGTAGDAMAVGSDESIDRVSHRPRHRDKHTRVLPRRVHTRSDPQGRL